MMGIGLFPNAQNFYKNHLWKNSNIVHLGIISLFTLWKLSNSIEWVHDPIIKELSHAIKRFDFDSGINEKDNNTTKWYKKNINKN